MTFKIWLESVDQEDLKELASHVLSHERIGPFDVDLGSAWHSRLVSLLKGLGWGKFASDLELYRPSRGDVEYANSEIMNPLRSPSSDVLGYDHSRKGDFARSSSIYHGICNEIIGLIDRLIEDKDWWRNAIDEHY